MMQTYMFHNLFPLEMNTDISNNVTSTFVFPPKSISKVLYGRIYCKGDKWGDSGVIGREIAEKGSLPTSLLKLL
jgi:hypothetical protein